jgi:hypothetical protein
MQLAYITDHIPYAIHFNPEDGGNMFLRKVGIHLKELMASQPHRITS